MHTASDFTVTPPPSREPRILVLRPGFEGPATRYGIPATQSEHEIAGRVAEALGVAGFEVTAWQSPDAAPVFRVERVWAHDDGSSMSPREVAAWLAACPGLGEAIDATLIERGADADAQRRELRDGGR